jgi:three-Cys-motif partner protein
MGGSRPIPWTREPHTAAKHAIYHRYLLKWWPIMVRGFGGNLTYCEGFAGPGVYDQREPGSPIIALRALFSDRSLKGRLNPARLLLVDENPRCVELLKQRLVVAVKPNWEPEQWREIGVHIEVQKGECEPHLEQLLDKHQAWDHPILAVLDTWGGGVSARLLRRIAKNKASEAIITIQPQYFARFAEVEDIEHGNKVFGSSTWREVANQTRSAKTSWLRNHYRQTIEACGFQYVLDFELADESGHVLYLVFGTNHKRGLQKMKEAMWEVDDVYGTGYRDPRDPNQETLQIEVEPQTAPLRRLLLAHLATLPERQATLNDLRSFALFRTVYKESQARQVVFDMLEEDDVVLADGNGPVRFESLIRLA